MAIVTVPRERNPLVPSDRPRFDPQPNRRVAAFLTSLDTGLFIQFILAPSEHDRNFGADWQDAGLAEHSIQKSEYIQTRAEERVYHIIFDAYNRPGGIVNDIEKEYKILRTFTERVPGKPRAHKLRYTQGVQSFTCALINVSMPVSRIATSGGAQRSHDCTITLKELPGRGR